MLNKATMWNRMCAAITGEVSADTLEAYRRASLAVYDALEHCEEHRRKAKEEGFNAWTLPPSTQAEILCTWNAFVLQTLGDKFLDADYEGDPHTVGFVPAITSDQILRFYGQVEGWLNRAQQAHYNPDYKLDVAVPAEFPAWSEVEPCPNAHLFGMMEAMQAVRDHTEAALIFLNDSPPSDKEHEKSLNQIRQLHAAAMTTARYADDMMSGNPTRDVHERVEEHVKDAIEKFYLLGQLLAMPQLSGKVITMPAVPSSGINPLVSPFNPVSAFASPSRLAGPKEAGFDMWCLTDPDARKRFQDDREAVRAIKTLWSLDPDPRRTVDIQSEINAALARGDVDYCMDKWGKKLGHFFCAPWGAVYVAKRPVNIGGRHLPTMQQFIFNVTCEGVNLGAPFEREIMMGQFRPTSRFEYGDPNEQPDH